MSSLQKNAFLIFYFSVHGRESSGCSELTWRIEVRLWSQLVIRELVCPIFCPREVQEKADIMRVRELASILLEVAERAAKVAWH